MKKGITYFSILLIVAFMTNCNVTNHGSYHMDNGKQDSKPSYNQIDLAAGKVFKKTYKIRLSQRHSRCSDSFHVLEKPDWLSIKHHYKNGYSITTIVGVAKQEGRYKYNTILTRKYWYDGSGQEKRAGCRTSHRDKNYNVIKVVRESKKISQDEITYSLVGNNRIDGHYNIGIHVSGRTVSHQN